MSKRSDFERIPRDFYKTFDPRAAAALAPHLRPKTRYVEPCAGDGSLIRLLEPWGHRCVAASDIHPDGPGIQIGDARQLRRVPVPFDCFITNPPWDRALLQAIIWRLSRIGPAWLLFDADWMHGKIDGQPKLLPYCSDIVSIGRLRWIPDTKDDGKDNCAWYRFQPHRFGLTRFHGRRL